MKGSVVPTRRNEPPSCDNSMRGGCAARVRLAMICAARSTGTYCMGGGIGSIRIAVMGLDFEQAKKLKRAAVERMVAGVYPGVYRTAHGLLGREDAAEGVIRFIVARAVKLLPAWR